MTPDNPYLPPRAATPAQAEFEAPALVLKKIRNAWIAALVSATLTLLFTVIAMTGNSVLGFSVWHLLDVVFILGMALGIARKSRSCAVLMLAYFLVSKLMLWLQFGNVSGLPAALVFAYFYWQGVAGTFAYHALAKRAAFPVAHD